jgi:hypothetical protein
MTRDKRAQTLTVSFCTISSAMESIFMRLDACIASTAVSTSASNIASSSPTAWMGGNWRLR